MREEKPLPERSALALCASFLVYAIPLPGPHAVPLLGTSLVAAFARPRPDATLALALLVFAVAAQALTFLVLRFVLRAPRRLLLLILYVPALVVVTYLMTMLLIPRFVLVDRDNAPENLSWPTECSIPEAAVHAVRSPLGQAGSPWVRLGRDGARYGRLALEGCAFRALVSAPPQGTMHAVVYAVSAGMTLESTWDVASQRTLWWWRVSPESSPSPLPLPGKLDGVPILSDDGSWLVTVERPEPPPSAPRLALRRLSEDHAQSIDLAGLPLGTYAPMAAAMSADATGTAVKAAISLSRSDEEFLTIDLEGRPTAPAFRPPGVRASTLSYRRVDAGGWAAWDAYVEDRPYAIAWATASGAGRHTAPRGRGISSLDLDPEGKWIAFSTSPIYSLGGVRDAVVILSTRDGREVFRHSLPPYTRSAVAFSGPGRLAYTVTDGRGGTEVRVVRAP